jgi:hypothetical protein
MWSLTSTRAKRIGGPEKFRPSGEKDFFNTICQKATSWLGTIQTMPPSK